MKIAVHKYVEEREHYWPAMLKFKSLQNPLNSIGDTAVRTDSGPRSRRTKCHNQKQLRQVTVQRALRWLASPFSRRAKQKPKNASAPRRLYRGQPPNSSRHTWQQRVKTSTQQPMQRRSNTLQGGVTVNQIRIPWLADNLPKENKKLG